MPTSGFITSVKSYKSYASDENISKLKAILSEYQNSIFDSLDKISKLDYSNWNDEVSEKLSSHTDFLNSNEYKLIDDNCNSDGNFPKLITLIEDLKSHCDEYISNDAVQVTSSVFTNPDDKQAWERSKSTSDLSNAGVTQYNNFVNEKNNKLDNLESQINADLVNIKNITFDGSVALMEPSLTEFTPEEVIEEPVEVPQETPQEEPADTPREEPQETPQEAGGNDDERNPEITYDVSRRVSQFHNKKLKLRNPKYCEDVTYTYREYWGDDGERYIEMTRTSFYYGPDAFNDDGTFKRYDTPVMGSDVEVVVFNAYHPDVGRYMHGQYDKEGRQTSVETIEYKNGDDTNKYDYVRNDGSREQTGTLNTWGEHMETNISFGSNTDTVKYTSSCESVETLSYHYSQMISDYYSLAYGGCGTNQYFSNPTPKLPTW